MTYIVVNVDQEYDEINGLSAIQDFSSRQQAQDFIADEYNKFHESYLAYTKYISENTTPGTFIEVHTTEHGGSVTGCGQPPQPIDSENFNPPEVVGHNNLHILEL